MTPAPAADEARHARHRAEVNDTTRHHSRHRIDVKSGDRYGKLVILNETEPQRKPSGVPARMFIVRCDCGTVKSVGLAAMRDGTTVSCGCFHREVAAATGAANLTTHGKSKDPLYEIWCAMKARCTNKNNKRWDRYGGRGIKVCERWANDFEAFLLDVGQRPAGTTIDRIRNDGDYEPGNVRWATPKQQARNTARNAIVMVNGQAMPLVVAAEQLGVKYDSLESSLRKGTPLAKSLGVTRLSQKSGRNP